MGLEHTRISSWAAEESSALFSRDLSKIIPLKVAAPLWFSKMLPFVLSKHMITMLITECKMTPSP